ncbi:glutaredoxin [Moorella sulfitireducens (nom. illeg.)]|uniref:glutaredoxin n=1 Tax=Neomoorella sulfitireducens TaxID=2972948 RepID=UPI0021AD3827|nr:glutaredoxin [Moorella sulfitireducens]
MNNIIFTVPGCTRCKIVKDFMKEKGIAYVEKDIKAEGKEEFQQFYTANRKSIYRGAEGIEFPIFTDGNKICQGIGPVLAYLNSGEKLAGYFSVGTLHREWVDGIHISSGNSKYADDLMSVLRYLKGNAMKLKVDTNGKHSHILQMILDNALADNVVMNVVGPPDLYSTILEEEVDLRDIEKTISLVPKFPEYQFQTTIVPVMRQEGEAISYLTPEEVALAAKFIEEVTRSKKHPYLIKLFNPREAKDERLKSLEPLSPNILFKYRTVAREYQMFAEVERE